MSRADGIAAGVIQAIGMAPATGCKRTAPTRSGRLGATNEIQDQDDQQDDHEKPNQAVAGSSDSKHLLS